MIQSSRKHLIDAGETYLEHMRFAVTVAMLTMGAGLACLIHAFVPALCQRTCSATVEQLRVLFGERDRLDDVQRSCEGVLTFISLLALSIVATLALIAAGGATPIILIISAITFAFPATYLMADGQLTGEA